MDIGLFWSITVAVFAVFGVCSLIKLTAEAFIMPEKYALAVMFDEKTDPEELGLLVNRARAAWYRKGAGKTIVLIYGGARMPDEVELAMREGGIPLYRVSAYSKAEDGSEE
jgi:hypothetical protein